MRYFSILVNDFRLFWCIINFDLIRKDRAFFDRSEQDSTMTLDFEQPTTFQEGEVLNLLENW